MTAEEQPGPRRPAGSCEAAGPGRSRWPVRAGLVPPLAEAFTIRPESVPGMPARLIPGAIIVLTDPPAGENQPREPGLISCGKTQLAAYLAESLWWARQLDLLIWVDATSRASILTGLVAATESGSNTTRTAEQAAAGFARWLNQTDRPWLLVLDDLRDPADLAGLWPFGPAGTVLITTADQTTVPPGPAVRIVPVGAFTTREALTVLMGRLSADPDQRRGAIDLANGLHDHPQALAQASAVITTTRLSCTDYLDHFTSRRDHLAQQTGAQPHGPATVTGIVSAEQANRLAPGGATQSVLTLAMLFGACPIPGYVFAQPAVATYLAETGAQRTGPDHAWTVVEALARTGLLTIDTTTALPVVRIAGPVVAQARAAATQETLDQAARAAADALAEAWPGHEPEPWLAASFRSCATNLLNTAGDLLWSAGDCHPVLLRAGHSLDAAHLTGPAASHWAHLAAISHRLLGPDHPTILTIGVLLARALLAAGHIDGALAWSRWALDSHTRRAGPVHPDTVAAQITAGQALLAAGKHDDAITVLDEAVGRYEHFHGIDHPATLAAGDELAAAYEAAGRHAEAAEVYRGTVAGRERILGPGHRDTLTAQRKLASACLAAGQYDEATTCYRQVLHQQRTVTGPNHPETIASLANLAQALQTAGDMAAALPLHEQAYRDSVRLLGADHPHTHAHKADLAHAYRIAGRLADAAVLDRDTLTRDEDLLPLLRGPLTRPSTQGPR